MKAAMWVAAASTVALAAGVTLTRYRDRAAKRRIALLAELIHVALDEHGIWLDEHAVRQLVSKGFFAPFTCDVTGDGSLALVRFVERDGRYTLVGLEAAFE